MSGHSKWATTKHRKGAQDKARAKLFAKLIRQVEVAAREGGGDLNSNATLRTMFQKARDGSVPARHDRAGDQARDGRARGRPLRGRSPTRATARAASRCSSRRSPTTATGRAPRCAALFSRNGGSMAEPGAVAWQFERKGEIEVGRDVDEDTPHGARHRRGGRGPRGRRRRLQRDDGARRTSPRSARRSRPPG